MRNWASLALRLSLGVMFFAHGIQIALGMAGGPGPEGFAKMLSGLGFAPAILWSYLAGYSILVAGGFLILGLFTRLACVPLLIFMLVALLKVHLREGFFLSGGGYEYNFIIIFSLIALILLGEGDFGITKRILKKKAGKGVL